MRRSFVVPVLAVSFVWVSYGSAYAQFGALNKLKKAAEKIEEKKPDAPKPDEKPAETARPDDKAPAPAGGTSATPAAADPSKTDASGQPVMSAVKIDFVPGERTVFFDDFSDMAPDEPPPHWKVRGGVVSLKLGNGAHVLAPGEGITMTSSRISAPKDFTFEVVCNCKGEIEWNLRNASDQDVLYGTFAVSQSGTSASTDVDRPGQPQLGSGEVKLAAGQPLTFALWAQQGRVRAYLNGERVVDANQVDFAGVDHIVLQPARYRPTDIVSVRMAESTPDFGTTLANTGKYVSHGIHFATDSDRLEPDSAPVLKMIAGGLIKNPSLKLAINGYTDSTGDANHNLDLSKRRAAAVREVLVNQFGIDQARLTADGFGAQNPIGSNDTADGRAQNRRVEFVKQQ